MKVLVADDTDVIRSRLLRQISALPGVSATYESFDYASTVKSIEREKPDVLVLDMFMPGGTGLEVLEQIRERNLRCHTLVLSSAYTAAMHSSCLKAGAGGVYHKADGFLRLIEEVEELAASA